MKRKAGIRFEVDVSASEHRRLYYINMRPGEVLGFRVWPCSVDHFDAEAIRIGDEGETTELPVVDPLRFGVNDTISIWVFNRSGRPRLFRGSLTLQNDKL